MKTIQIVTMLVLMAGIASAGSLESMRSAYTNAAAKITFEGQKQKDDALAQYGKSLGTILTSLKQKGDIDGYTVVDQESKRLKSEKVLPLCDPNALYATEVASCRKQLLVADTNSVRRKVDLLKRYVPALGNLVKDLMAQDKLAEAKAAGDEKKAMEFTLAELESGLPKEEARVEVKADVNAVTSVATSASQKTDKVLYDEKYDKKSDGWIKGGTLNQGQLLIGKTSGKMTSPTAMCIRQKNLSGEMEIKKSFALPAESQGKEITVEALLGYNFINEYVATGPNAPGGHTRAKFTVKLLDRRGEIIAEKCLDKDDKSGGTLEGTLADMAVNRVVFASADTAKAASIQVFLKVEVEANGNRPKSQTCMSEFWIRSLTIR